jgi:hypothetical protein
MRDWPDIPALLVREAREAWLDKDRSAWSFVSILWIGAAAVAW